MDKITLKVKTFQAHLLNWAQSYGRKNFPWQHSRTPYRVWLSETMLQQTQANTVIPYFQRFIQRFPDLESLAKADLDQILQLWGGLGYYARARNLHQCARLLIQNYQGAFPGSLEILQTLPGIGRSTAGAILALGFSQKASILDGNVKRILSRFHAIEGWPGTPAVIKKLWSLAERYTPQEQVAQYTQGIMDLGALICTRAQPKCQACPISNDCLAYIQKNVEAYPTPKPRKIRPVRKMQLIILLNAQKQILLEKRPPCGIWGGLWSLPECPGDANILQWCQQTYYCDFKTLLYQDPIRHNFSHFEVSIQPVVIPIIRWKPLVQDTPQLSWSRLDELDQKGLAAPIKKLLGRLSLILVSHE